MIGKVPKEELNALFYEIYKKEESTIEAPFGEENTKEPIYIFYGYKFKNILNSFLSKEGTVPAFVKEFKINNFGKEIKKTYIGYLIENKYRIFFDIENIIREGENSIVDTVPFEIVSNLTKDMSLELLKALELRARQLNSFYTYFYTEEVLEYIFALYIEDKPFNLKIYLEKDFLDSGLISSWIISSPTPEEKKRIEKLKKKTYIELNVETEPLEIDLSKNLVKLPNDIKFEVKND